MAFKSRNNKSSNGGDRKVTTITSLNNDKNVTVNTEMKAVSKTQNEIESYKLAACDILDKLEQEHGIDIYDDGRKPGMYMNMGKVNGNKLNLQKVHKRKVTKSDKSKLSLIEKLKQNGRK